MSYKRFISKTVRPSTLVSMVVLAAVTAFAAGKPDTATEAAQFLELYNRLYQSLYTVAQEAAWKSSTDVSPEHTGQRIGAAQAQAVFVGNPWVIEKTKALLQQTNKLD